MVLMLINYRVIPNFDIPRISRNEHLEIQFRSDMRSIKQ